MTIDILRNPFRVPSIKRLVCPLNREPTPGPITHVDLFPNHILTDEEIRLYKKLAPLPKTPPTESSSESTSQS